MNQKEITETFIMISNLKKPLVSMVYTKKCERFKGASNIGSMCPVY